MWFLLGMLGCVEEAETGRVLYAEAGLSTPAVDDLGLVYEVYVRSFFDHDGDGTGDLAGLNEKLPYLEELGVETLWLMPIFEADAVAGYGVTDYSRIAPEYGTDADFAALIEAAHEQGMRVLLDLPLNHVSRQHPWFAAAESGDRRDRFLFSEAQYDEYRWFPTACGAYYYGFFGPNLPDLNWENPALYAEMLGLMRGWLDRGVDGFRLDAASTLVEGGGEITHSSETHTLLAQLRSDLEASHPHARLLAEAGETVLSTNLEYLGSNDAPEAHALLDFPLRAALLSTLNEANPTAIRTTLAYQGDLAAANTSFLGSHDVSRLASTVTNPAIRRVLLAALFTLPATPVLYYGDELDLVDSAYASGQDYSWRAPMPWNSTVNAGFTTAQDAWLPPDPSSYDGQNVEDESNDPTSTLSFVRALASLRLATPALRTGELRFLPSEAGVLSFERVDGSEVLRVDLNFGDQAGEAAGEEIEPQSCSVRHGTVELLRC